MINEMGLRPSKGMVYYTDSRFDGSIASEVRFRLSCVGYPIVSVSHEPLPGFGKNIVVDMKPGVSTMFRQILIGLEASETDIIFLTEHDVLYDPAHFEFTPPRKDVFYYNTNTWVVNEKTKKGMIYKQMQTSGLCAYRKLLVKHYRTRVEMLDENESVYMQFEPGLAKNVDDYQAESWTTENPNIDIRHDGNLTGFRFMNLK